MMDKRKKKMSNKILHRKQKI